MIVKNTFIVSNTTSVVTTDSGMPCKVYQPKTKKRKK